MKRRITVVLPLAVLLAACSDDPLRTQTRVETPLQLSVSAAAAGFTFLEPLGPAASVTGDFNAAALPTVEICSDGPACASVVGTFTTAASGSERVRLLDDREGFIVNWDTRNAAPAAYTIRVRIGERTSGTVDVQVVPRGTDLRNVPPSRHGLVAGQTLPIKFWIPRGFDAAPLDASGGTLVLDGGAVRIEAPPGAVQGSTVITVEPLPADPDNGVYAVYDFGPDGAVFSNGGLSISLPFRPSQAPAGAVPGLFLRQNETDEWEPLEGSYDADAGTVTGVVPHFTQIGVLLRKVHVCPDGSGAATLAEAAERVGPRGRVTVCGGTHSIDSVAVSKPMTITDTLGTPQLVGTSPQRPGIVVDGISRGQVVLNNLAISNLSQGVRVSGTYDDVVLESMLFTANSVGIYATLSSVVGARITVSNSRFIGGNVGMFAPGAPRVDVLDSHFSGQLFSNIQYQGLTNPEVRLPSGTVSGNRISECGRNGCIRVVGAGQLVITGNDLRTTKRAEEFPAVQGQNPGVQAGIVAWGSDILVEDNTIEGLGDVPEQNNIFAYAFADAAISLPAGFAPSQVTLNRNRVRNALNGIHTQGQAVTVVGTDNIVDLTGFAVRVNNGARLTMRRNDFTRYLLSISSNMGLTPGDLVCNWWGTPAGAQNPSVNAPYGAYAPAASQPIAGNAGVVCDPTPAPAPALVRFCPSAPTGDVPTYASMGSAYSAVATGGTIRVCDGVFRPGVTNITRAVTVEADPGATPVLDGNTNPVFQVRNAGPGTITVRGLTFRNSRWASIDVQGYDRVVIENSVFFPATDPQPEVSNPGNNTGVGYFAGVSVGQGAGNGVIVRNSTFSDGDIGVNTWGNAQVQVLDNTFTNLRNSAVHLGGASEGLVQGNVVNGCGPIRCIGAFGAAAVILGNTLTVDQAAPTQTAVHGTGSALTISDNVITGTGGSRAPGDAESWPIRNAAILTNMSGTVVADGNTVAGAFAGLAVYGVTSFTGSNNAVRSTSTALVGYTASTTFRSNDITDYVTPVAGDAFAGAGAATCNWWGSAAGPLNMPPSQPANSYTPWETSPIAGTNRPCM